MRQAVALSIAGSDSGAGAGIQADLKTFSSLGVYGCTVLTVVTAQSTSSVDMVEALPAALVRQQLETVFSDFRVSAAKTGALGSRKLIETVAGFLSALPQRPALVVDPVMISKHGFRLIDEDAVDVLKTRLFPLATVITPNLHEAAALTGRESIEGRQQMQAAAEELLGLGCGAVLLKGGHSSAAPDDLLLQARGDAGRHGVLWLSGERIDTQHTHGTGCTFSAALCASLARGASLTSAAREAKQFISGALRGQQLFGRGINPVNHFWRQMPQFGRLGED
ncbi:bifunctional hydroxymethylpyrimidine kinase/phosphomethylpyrimidine kinase [bacterium]|nr:bifunctional hydroxymethylpyrimidine kinase/phosphomethylpyrimidine kinase [bacterium]